MHSVLDKRDGFGLNCPKCGSVMKPVMGKLGIPFLQCVQYENHKEPYEG